MNGKGIRTYDNGVYEGEFKDGLKNGQGTFKWKNGDKYTG